MLKICQSLASRLLGLFSLVLIVTIPMFALVGSGTIRGKVIDSATKDVLPGASVVVAGTSLGAAADLSGNFIIHNIPAGTYTIKVSYVGYATLSVQVTVPEDGEVMQDFSLVTQAVEGQPVVITAQAVGQIEAINQQLSSNTIVNVVSQAKIQELPDFNAAEAIGRLPGVSTLRSSGEANKVVIRGMAPQFNIVYVDNIALASTGKDDKSVDLTMITPYMLQSIDVYKSLTPDMEANAIGGAVNMQLREAPSGLHSDLMWQSGYTAKDSKYNNYKALGAVSDRFFDDDFGAYLLLNAEQYDRGADNFNASYRIVSDPTAGQTYGPVSVANMTLDRHFETRSRYGANLILDYRLKNGGVSMINMASRLRSNYQDYNTSYDFIGKNLGFTYGSGLATTDLAVNAVQTKYDFDVFSLDASVSNSYSRNYNPKIANFVFAQGAGIASTPIPQNTPPEDLVALAQFDTSKNFLQQVGYNFASYKENDQTAKANVKVPFSFASMFSGFLKFGGVYRHYNRDNDENAPYAQLRYQGNELVGYVRAENFPFLEYDPGAQQFRSTLLSNYDPTLMSSFLDNKYGNLIWASQVSPLNTLTDWIIANHSNSLRYYAGEYANKINDYEYIEKYEAGYGMMQLNVGPDLLIVGGVRYEADFTHFVAYRVQQQNTWALEKAYPDTATPSNHFLLPMVQARYSIFDWSDIRYAYTQTLARPSYTQLSPYVNMDQNGQGVNAGNPELKPAQAYNHDLMLTLHSNELGLFSVGAFYKTIYDFSYFIQYELLPQSTLPGYDTAARYPGAQPGATLSTFYNNPYKAIVKGLEVDLQTRFWYLPFPFDGVVLGINYTHIKSETSYPLLKTRVVPPVPPARVPTTVLVDSSRSGRMIFQPNDIANVSLGYDYDGFSGRLSFLFQGNMVSGIGTREEQDGFTKDYFKIDASLRQKLPWEGLQIFLDVNNINQRADISVQKTIGGSTSEAYYGLTAELGLRYTY